jgi:hypothetical protein
MTPALSADKRKGIPIQEQTNKHLQSLLFIKQTAIRIVSSCYQTNETWQE